ncbi:MAG: hypothetical protein ABI041_02560, partial [Bdellovibrionia bacterium]
CNHIPRDLDETTQTPEFIADRLEQYWLHEGGRKKWTKQAEYFVKKRKDPVNVLPGLKAPFRVCLRSGASLNRLRRS